MSIIDGHAHLQASDESARRLLATMDASQIGRTVVVAGGTRTPFELSENMLKVREYDVPIDNMGVKSAAESSAGRLLPFYFANPHGRVAEYQMLGRLFYGLKLGPTVHGVALNDDRNLKFVEEAALFHHPVYFHCLAKPGFDVESAVALATRFPSVKFILGHAGIGNCDFYAIKLVEKIPNLSFETSGGFSAVIQTAVKQLGAARVIFGSEYPLQNPNLEISKLLSLDLTESERLQVMATNMHRLVLGRFE